MFICLYNCKNEINMFKPNTVEEDVKLQVIRLFKCPVRTNIKKGGREMKYLRESHTDCIQRKLLAINNHEYFVSFFIIFIRCHTYLTQHQNQMFGDERLCCSKMQMMDFLYKYKIVTD